MVVILPVSEGGLTQERSGYQDPRWWKEKSSDGIQVSFLIGSISSFAVIVRVYPRLLVMLDDQDVRFVPTMSFDSTLSSTNNNDGMTNAQ